MSARKRILTVALDSGMLQRVSSIFDRQSLSVEACELAAEALLRGLSERYHLIICRYPLPDLRLREFVAGLRGSGSACRHASLLLLTIPEMMTEASLGIDDGRFLVFSGQERSSAIAQGAAQLLEVAPRHAPRIRARLGVKVRGVADSFTGWVVNLSTTGMLVADSPMLPVGAECGFDFTLPNGEAVRGSAMVVRHAAPRREKVTGFALRFLEFEGDGRVVLEHWCEGDQA